MISDTIKSQFNDSKLMNVSTIDVTVDMSPSALTEKLAKEVHMDILRLAGKVGASNVDVELDGILKYLKTLTYLRVSLANGDMYSPANKAYRNITKHVCVPVMFYQCLISIGIAFDKDYGIRFRPTYSIDSTDLLSPEEVMEISDLMQRFENLGLKIVIGIPQSEEGELDFMALTHVESQVLGYRRSHPVYGFLAAFFRQKKLSEVTGMMCRVVYGYETDYELYVSKIYAHMSK